MKKIAKKKIEKIERVFNKVPLLDDEKLEFQVNKQIEFLKLVHPDLKEDAFQEGAVEIRPLKRDGNISEYIRSFYTWRFEENDKHKFKDFMNNINGKGICLYFSVYSFEFEKDVVKKNGKKYEKGKINNENALYTSVLPMDFDNISFDEFMEQKNRLLEKGIETIDIFTGHGFQSFILLSEKTNDKEILRKFTRLMISKGFKVDEAIRDPARVLRLPYSFNCKAMDSDSKYYDEEKPEIKATTDIFWTEKRYNLIDIFESLNEFKDVIEHTPDEKEEVTKEAISTINKVPLSKQNTKDSDEGINEKVEKEKSLTGVNIEELNSLYSINLNKVPSPIIKMLNGSEEGMRNSVMFFLIPFFRNSKGLSKNRIKELMVKWGARCEPSLGKEYIHREVERIYELGLKSKMGAYTEELRKAYGYIEFESYKVKSNKIIIENKFMEDIKDMSGAAVKIYFAMKYSERLLRTSDTKQKQFIKEDLSQITDYSARTIERNMKQLVNKGYVVKKRKNRRRGEKSIYYINTFFNITKGFTMFDLEVVDRMVGELTGLEIKLYAYLCRMIGADKNVCWDSQRNLSRNIGSTSTSSISKGSDSLMAKGFIDKVTEEVHGVKHTRYMLKD